jgi:hypothetical protein
MALWDEVNASLREAGVLVKNEPLHGVATATTVRFRGDEDGVVPVGRGAADRGRRRDPAARSERADAG